MVFSLVEQFDCFGVGVVCAVGLLLMVVVVVVVECVEGDCFEFVGECL